MPERDRARADIHHWPVRYECRGNSFRNERLGFLGRCRILRFHRPDRPGLVRITAMARRVTANERACRRK